MLIRNKIFVFEPRFTKFGGLVVLPKGCPKMPKKVGQSSPVSAKVDQSSNFDPQYLLPQGVFRAILTSGDRGP